MVATERSTPPAGANPLFMVHNHADFMVLLNPVGAGILVLFLVAMFWSCVRPSKKYPGEVVVRKSGALSLHARHP